jgi:hypothetical protein
MGGREVCGFFGFKVHNNFMNFHTEGRNIEWGRLYMLGEGSISNVW